MNKEISKRRRDIKTLKKMKKINENATKSLSILMTFVSLIFWARCRYRVSNLNNQLIRLDLNRVLASEILVSPPYRPLDLFYVQQ